jgi:hypothetical protein
MKRSLLLCLAWLASAAVLYVLALVLELVWNLYDWQPSLDWQALGPLLGMAALLAGMRRLAKAAGDRVSRAVSLVMCLALLALAVYVLPPEPPGHGLFARQTPSPFWYRGGRLVVLALPGVFWCLGFRHRRVGVQAAQVAGGEHS